MLINTQQRYEDIEVANNKYFSKSSIKLSPVHDDGDRNKNPLKALNSFIFPVLMLIIIFCMTSNASSQSTSTPSNTAKHQSKVQPSQTFWDRLRPVVQLGHVGKISSAVLSPDGSLLLSGGWDSQMKLWEVTTGREVQTYQTGNVDSVEFSPDGSKALIAVGNIVKLLELNTGRELWSYKGGSCPAVFSPDGKRVFSQKEWSGKPIMVLDAKNGAELRTFHSKKIPQNIRQMIFSPNNKNRLLSIGDYKEMFLWDIKSGEKVKTYFNEYVPDTNKGFAFSSNGLYFVTPYERSYYDIKAAQKGFPPYTYDIAALWDTKKGSIVQKFTMREMPQTSVNVNSVAISLDGKKVLTGDEGYNSTSGEIILWDSKTGNEIHRMKGHKGAISKVLFTPNNRFAISASYDSTLKLWDLNSGKNIKTYSGSGGSSSIFATAYTPDGRYLLTAGKSNNLDIWEPKSGRLIKILKGHKAPVNDIRVSLDSRYALSIDIETRYAKLWNLEEGLEILSIRPPSTAYTNYIAISPGSRFLLKVSDLGNTLTLFKLSNGQPVSTFTGIDFGFAELSFSIDGKFLLVDNPSELKFRVLELASGTTILSGRSGIADTEYLLQKTPSAISLSFHGQKVEFLTLHPNHKLRPYYGLDAFPVKWDRKIYSPDRSHSLYHLNSSETGAKLCISEIGTNSTYMLGKARAYGLAFSPDGHFAVSGGDDQIVSYWDLKTRQLLWSSKGHHGTVYSASFSPDGQFVTTGSRDGTVKIWNTNTGTKIATLQSSTDDEWIAYTPDGYYQTSPEGTNIIHWVANNDTETFTFEQFESQFRKPGIIKSRLAGNFNKKAKQPIVSRPPHIDFSDHMALYTTEKNTYTISFKATSGRIVKTVRIFNNSKPTLEIAVNKKKKIFKVDVPLTSGANKISILAYDDQGISSNPKMLDVVKEGEGRKPNLHIVAIGISAYPRLSTADQLEFAHTDALALTRSLQAQEGQMFQKVSSTVLTNNEASPSNIKSALKKLSKMDGEDIAVVFLAGHGVRVSDGAFYFMTQDGNFSHPEAGGLNWESLRHSLGQIKGRTLLFLDACHSGSLVTETIVPNNELAERFFTGHQGGTLIFSASKGRQFSHESPDVGGGFGLFTYMLTQALNQKSQHADTNGNGFVEFMELVDYVSDNVDKETAGTQTPWLSRKELFGDFAIAKVRK